MPSNRFSSLSKQSDLHKLLKGYSVDGINGRIDLGQRFSDIKKDAQKWLKVLGKNGYEHSDRIERYLDKLSKKMIKKNLLSPVEIFVLLCATYMHDVGYWCADKCVQEGHPERSREYIINNPSKYLLHDFPPFRGKHPRVVEAVGWVVYGHSEERFLHLKEVPNDFADQALSDTPLNLRKLAALLRIADEADDPYIRPKGTSSPSIRDQTPLVRIGTETIAWHWEHTGLQESDEFVSHLNEKMEVLVTSFDYLRDIGAGNWYLVLHPQVKGTVPYMAEKRVDTFVGRESDLKELHNIIKGRRTGAITGVTGTGGIGKTELARMYAEVYRNEYPGGVFWASLKSSNWKTEAEKVFAAIRPGANRVVFPDEDKAKEQVTKALGRKGALIIIDNVEEADQIVEPECSILVTTRNKGAFGIVPKESICSLEGLKPGDGIDLLKMVLGPTRVNQDLKGAARIVKILGCMPLAIEIAAKHLNDAPDTTFPQYIGWVQGKMERLKLDDHPDKDVIASLTLSLELLEKGDRGDELLSLFEATSVCAESGFTSSALGSAAGFRDMDLMVLQQLVGKLHNRSLIEYSNELKRYSVHPLVRQMSELRLKENKRREEEFRKNHCIYFFDWAKAHSSNPLDLIQEKDGIWLAMVQIIQLGRKKEKLPAFLDCISKPFWDYVAADEYEDAFDYLVASNLINIEELGRSRELINLLGVLFEKKTLLKNSSLSLILNKMGWAYIKLGEYPKAIELHEKHLEIARRIGDVRGEGNTLGNMGSVYGYLGNHHKAIELYEQALEITRRTGDVWGEGANLGNMGVAYSDLGNYPKAIELYEQRLEIARRIGDVRGEGNTLGNMGIAFADLGNYPKAFELYEQRLEIARRIGDVGGEGSTLGGMGLAYIQLGDHPKAFELFEKYLEIARRIGDVRGESNALSYIGMAYSDLGDYPKTIELYEKALEIDRRIGNVVAESTTLANMGSAYADQEDYPKALEHFKQVLKIDRQTGDIRGEGKALGNMGVAYDGLGDYPKAFELYKQALKIARRIGNVRSEGNILGNMGAAYADQGDYSKAVEHFKQELEIARRIGNVRGEGKALCNMGVVYADLGENEKSQKCFKTAIDLFKRLNLNHMVIKLKQMAKLEEHKK